MWRGVAMPQGVPQDAIEYWTDIIRKVGESTTFQEYIKNNVASLNVLTGSEFTAFLGRQENLYRDLLGIERCQRPPSGVLISSIVEWLLLINSNNHFMPTILHSEIVLADCQFKLM
jgi:hypothetical protein